MYSETPVIKIYFYIKFKINFYYHNFSLIIMYISPFSWVGEKISFLIFLILSVCKVKIDKFGFVELEFTLFCGRYLELAETNQPPLCKGRGTTKWWKDCLVGTLDYIRFIRYMM